MQVQNITVPSFPYRVNDKIGEFRRQWHKHVFKMVAYDHIPQVKRSLGRSMPNPYSVEQEEEEEEGVLCNIIVSLIYA